MSLGYPTFLWALLALAIPIVIHLFNFRKTTRVYFSNTQFLKKVQTETTKKRKLKNYLVLASRLLFLFFLVMAFTQPYLPAKEQMGNSQNRVIYVDNSFSMSSPVSEKVRALDDALRMAQTIADMLPPSTRYQLLTNDFAAYSNSFKTKSEISDLLSQIKLSPISRSAAEIMTRIKEKHSTLFWISDFQKSTFGASIKVDTFTQIRLIPIALQKNANIYVDTVYLKNPFAIGGEKNTLTIRLRNDGNKKIEGLSTKLSLNGVQAAATAVTIEPNSFVKIPFDIASDRKGSRKAVISFTDFPISFDNEFFVALNFSKRIRVIEIKSITAPTYVEKVFGNKNVFAFKSFTTANLNYSVLASADLIVLNGIDRIDNALAGAINSYKKSFGALLLVPSAKPDISSYQKIIFQPITQSTPTEKIALDKPNLQNPIFANVFEDNTTTMGMPWGSAVLDWGSDRSAILKFKNNKPFLSQFEKIFLLACPLEKEFTDFYNHALFVPVMYRIAAAGKKTEQPLYYSLSAPTLLIPSDSIATEDPVRLIGTQELIPSQRKSNNMLVMELPKYAVSTGFYTVANKRDTLGLIAFNLDKKESQLQPLKPEEVKANLGGQPSISIFKGSAESFGSELKENYLGTPLWKYAIVLSLLFLLAEILLIRLIK